MATLVCAMALILLLANRVAHATLRVVATTGSMVETPMGVSLVRYSRFTPPVINNKGHIVFRASLIPIHPGYIEDGLVEEVEPGHLFATTMSRQLVHSDSERIATLADPITLNNNGDIAFYSFEDYESGTWWQRSSVGEYRRIARTGETTSDGIRFSFRSFDPVGEGATALNDAGQVAFFEDNGVWFADSDSEPQLIARTGEPADALPGFEFARFSRRVLEYPLFLSPTGKAVFWGEAHKGNGNFTSDSIRGLWEYEPGGGVELIAAESLTPPGLADKFHWNMNGTGGDFSMNAVGDLVFAASIRDPANTTNSSTRGIWQKIGSNPVEPLVVAGDPIGGDDPSGGVLQSIGPISLSGEGSVVFDGSIAYGGDDGPLLRRAIMEGSIYDDRDIKVIAEEGQIAPGVLDGARFASVLTGNSFALMSFGHHRLTTNDAGQTAFSAFLTGDGVDSSNDRGIWAQDRNGQLHLIARTGQEIEVAPGVFKTITSLDFWGNTNNKSGLPSGFNDRGELVFAALFERDLAIIVSSKVAVPEPSTHALALLGILSVGGRARRSQVAS